MEYVVIVNIVILCIALISLIVVCIQEKKKKKQYKELVESYNIQEQALKKIEIDISEKKCEVLEIKEQEFKAKSELQTWENRIKDVKNLESEYQKKITQHVQKIGELKSQVNNYYQKEKSIVENQLKDFKQTSSNAASIYFDNLEKEYEHAEARYKDRIASLKEEQSKAAASLNKLKETRAAAHEALLKQQEVKDNKDNYRLLPSPSQLSDIVKLERVKLQLTKPRVLSMLIWQTFFQPIAKEKFPVILQAKTKTGIYKITNLKTDQCYIGQSLDVYKRWSDHCKAGLGIDTPVGNKLYKAIQNYGLENFTFQLLCECPKEQLNEKEKYFIELYQSDTYGYNGNIGINK